MGEYADMMIEGDVCSQCGGIIFDESGEPTTGDGIPRVCSECAKDRASRGAYPSQRTKPKKRRRR